MTTIHQPRPRYEGRLWRLFETLTTTVSILALFVGVGGLVFVFVSDAREPVVLGGAWVMVALVVVARIVAGVIHDRRARRRAERRMQTGETAQTEAKSG
jgi:uncharacterized membrane protein YdcZ (DUF606 family)